MSIFVIGINHRTAPIILREKIYFSLEKTALYLQDLLNRGLASEAVLISTCNRSELYCEADNERVVRDWFYAQTAVQDPELASVIYVYQDEEAVEHIMQVACGLDSMILGEPQILGQLKAAYSESCAASAVNGLFHRLFQQVFSVAKEVRTTTAIGACPVSVASAAVHFAREQMADFNQAQVTLIGAGDTVELLIRYLKAYLINPITLVNRSVEKAKTLVEGWDSPVYGFDRLMTALLGADIVFSATGSVTPILTKTIMMDMMAQRQGKPIILIDIAVPRDVDAAVMEVADVKVYSIDDLKVIIEKNRQGRKHAAEKAREMVRKKSMELMEELKSLDTITYTIRAYRRQIEAICHLELVKARQQLQHGVNPTDVLNAFALAFTKKLLHTPSVQLRQAGVEGRFEVLKFAKQLFAIPDPDIERL